ncbi:MAG: type II toxin-antitoxin system RelE/ParE family toxin [Ignavibacteriae bacterium]|nr:type II toxin-antitoxin system RelE/ParE family toxin [Ignavibacteriota bacterium]
MNQRKYQVRLLPVAETDLTEIVEYILEENPRAAIRLLERIEKNIGFLARHPLLGKIPEDEELAQIGYRFLVVENYLVFYTIEERTVVVHRILHGARNYLSILK